jgi:hypothetical protein
MGWNLVMEWFQQLWFESKWYERVYLFAFGSLALSVLIFLLVLVPYIQVKEKIMMEYKGLCSQHFFISFRTKKQMELYKRAELRIGSRDRKYLFYQLGNFTLFLSSLSFGVAFWFYIGSMIYENFIDTPVTPENLPIITDNDDYEDDTYYDDEEIVTDDDNIHHVDPHWVEGYERSDGTEVDGYWRGGEDGYERSDPDGDVTNNLDYEPSSDFSDDGENIFDFLK